MYVVYPDRDTSLGRTKNGIYVLHPVRDASLAGCVM